MDEMPGPPWAEIFKKLVKTTPPDTIVNFGLWWRDPQQNWASPGARVIQVGDSAHSYLPSSGNGATQAIEDAISLASCLQIGGKENIPQSVRAHIRFRCVSQSTLRNCTPALTIRQFHSKCLRPKAGSLQLRAPPSHRLGESEDRPTQGRPKAPEMGVGTRPRSILLRELRKGG